MKPLNQQNLYIFLLCLINKNKQSLLLKKNSQLDLDYFLATLCFDENKFFNWEIANISYKEGTKYKEDSSCLSFSKKHHEKTEILSITINLNERFIKKTSNHLREYLKKFITNQLISKSTPLFQAHLDGFKKFLDQEKKLLNKNNITLSSNEFDLAVLGRSRSRQLKYKPRFLDFIAVLWFSKVVELTNLGYRTRRKDDIFSSNFKLLKDNVINANYFFDQFGIENSNVNVARINITTSAIEYNQSTKQLTINTKKGQEITSFKTADSQRKTLETFLHLLNEEIKQPWSYDLVIDTRTRLFSDECYRQKIKNDVDNIRKKIGKRKMNYLSWSYQKDTGWVFLPS